MTDESMTIPDLGGLTCKEMVELVTDYLEGALPPAIRIRFDQHLTACDPCVAPVGSADGQSPPVRPKRAA